MINENIAIIGSGIGGLGAAYYLNQKNPNTKITIFEKASDIGGLASHFPIQNTQLEKFYHHIFTTDTYIINLIEELNLSKDLVWYKDNTAIFYNNKLFPFMGAIDLLKFKPLSIIERLRMGIVMLFLSKYYSRGNNWKKLENINAQDWLIKYAGKKGYEIIWKPLLIGKFADKYNQISMSWLWARISTRANSNGKLGYMTGSFIKFFESLSKTLKEKNIEIKNNITIENIERKEDTIEIEYIDNNKRVEYFDKVIITTSAGIYTKFLKGLTDDYIQNVTNIEHLSAQTIILTSKERISPYYWISVNDISAPALAVIEQTNLESHILRTLYNKKHILYLGNYLKNDSPILKMSDKELQEHYYPFLKKLNKDFKKDWIEDMKVFRMPYAQPIVTTSYNKHIPTFDSPVKNVYILNMSQVYPEDRGMNFALKNAYNLIQNYF